MKILLTLPAVDHLRVTRGSPEITKRTMFRFSLLPLTTVEALTPAGHALLSIFGQKKAGWNNFG